MNQHKKIIVFVCVGILVSLGVSALIYLWPPIKTKVSQFPTQPTSQQAMPQSPGRVTGLKDSSTGMIQNVSKDRVTIQTADKTTKTYLFATPRVYVLFRNQLGVKGFIRDLKEGQSIEFAATTDNKGDAIVTSIIIEQ